MIKAVLFDVDGVLIDSFDSIYYFYKDLFNTVNCPFISKLDFLKISHLPMEGVIREITKLKDKKEILKIWKIGKNHIDRHYNKIKYPKNLNTIIKTLNKNYILGIVTSRIKGKMFEIKKLKDLKKYFKTVVYYDDTKKHKPEPDPLLYAIKSLKINPKETVYIGDNESDIKASRAANIKIILYSKNKIKGADAYTNSFKQIPSIIKNLK